MFLRFAKRDAAIVALTVLAWWGLAGRSAAETPLGDFLGFLVGAAFGASVYLVHEWGHALGAMATGGVLHPPTSLGQLSLFSFDSKRNSKGTFVVMSLGGFAVTACAVWLVYGALPEGLFATRVARGATLALASLTVFVEVPILFLGLLRSELPPVETFDPAASA